MSEILEVIEKSLAPLPHVALRAVELVDDEDSDASDLSRLISTDQGLASRILRFANSAHVGARGGVDSISRAVVTLGWKQVKDLVLVASFQAKHRAITFSDQLLWDHALAVSQTARRVAVRCRYPRIDEASTAGLVHDIGKVIMDQHSPDKYREVAMMLKQPGATFLAAEQEVLGFTHAEVGEMVVEKWGLSSALQEAVNFHHAPEKGEIDPTLCAIVNLANAICVQQGIGLENCPEMDINGLESTGILKLSAEDVEDLVEACAPVED